MERRISTGKEKCLFKGNGPATLTILGYKNWKQFLRCNERELTPSEIVDLEYAADYNNFSVEGVVRVEWPLVTVEFKADKFLGECSNSGNCLALQASESCMVPSISQT